MVNKSIIALLFIQALSLSVSAQTANKDSIAIDSIMHNLPEVMVSGERPMVKVNGNALIYDIKRITRNKPVDNIYEALKELPGVIEIGGKLTLGGQDVTVIVDGNKTNLTQEQLAQALRSIQTNRLENVEVMYNAPAQYNVRGACININFTHETAEQQK